MVEQGTVRAGSLKEKLEQERALSAELFITKTGLIARRASLSVLGRNSVTADLVAGEADAKDRGASRC